MKKAYFQYYETFEVILEKIKDIEEREHMRKTIINYGLYGTEPAGLSELEEMAWTICKELIDQQQHRREINAANRASKKAESTIEENMANETPAPDLKPAKEKNTKFVAPTIEEVKAFCETKGLKINLNKFYLHYESNGWHVGKNKMKSWQAAVQKWAETEKDFDGHNSGGTIYQKNTDAVANEYSDYF